MVDARSDAAVAGEVDLRRLRLDCNKLMGVGVSAAADGHGSSSLSIAAVACVEVSVGDELICRSCGGTTGAPKGGGAGDLAAGGPAFCSEDGAPLVAKRDHDRYPRDAFLGTRVGGRYPILAVLGVGGMGRVYRSVQPPLDRAVAIKVQSEASAGSPQALDRFLREAKVVGRLDHPAIVTLYDFGVDDDGTAFMVMELVEGETLTDALSNGGPTRQDVVEICAEVADALAVAHAHGIIHRDMKPANIMLRTRRIDGDEPVGRRAKVLDFGLARLADVKGGLGRLTETRWVVGTRRYMAPEQWRSEEPDPRTDIYSLGVVLYEALCGRSPFVETSDLKWAEAHCDTPPPALPDDVRPPLSAIVMRALAKDRADRFQSAAEMRDALRGLSESMSSRARSSATAPLPIPPASSNALSSRSPARGRSEIPRVWLAGLLAVGLLLVGLAVFGPSRPSPSVAPAVTHPVAPVAAAMATTVLPPPGAPVRKPGAAPPPPAPEAKPAPVVAKRTVRSKKASPEARKRPPPAAVPRAPSRTPKKAARTSPQKSGKVRFVPISAELLRKPDGRKWDVDAISPDVFLTVYSGSSVVLQIPKGRYGNKTLTPQWKERSRAFTFKKGASLRVVLMDYDIFQSDLIGEKRLTLPSPEAVGKVRRASFGQVSTFRYRYEWD